MDENYPPSTPRPRPPPPEPQPQPQPRGGYQYGHYRNPWQHYPTISLLTFIIRMVGVLIIFVGVVMIAFWIKDLGDPESSWSDPEEMFDGLGNDVLIIGIGGIVMSISYLIAGIAKFSKGKFEINRR